MPRAARETARWIGSALALLFVVTFLTFVLVALAPGDAAKSALSAGNGAPTYTEAQYRQMRHQLHLDQPLPVQYWHWLDGVLHGDFGTDLFNGQPVATQLQARIVPSLSIILGTVIVSSLLGVGLGIFSARRGGPVGRIIDAGSLIGFAVPSFWLALVLSDLLAVQRHVFPSIGYTSPGQSVGGWLLSIALPVATLAAGAVAFIAKQTRDAVADVLAQEYIVMLRARGLSRRSIIYKHALRNAAIPVVTVLGLLLVSLLSGTVLVESVFGIPGLGQLAVTASANHNLPVIVGAAFAFTVVVVIANLAVDISYRWLNPKVRRP